MLVINPWIGNSQIARLQPADGISTYGDAATIHQVGWQMPRARRGRRQSATGSGNCGVRGSVFRQDGKAGTIDRTSADESSDHQTLILAAGGGVGKGFWGYGDPAGPRQQPRRELGELRQRRRGLSPGAVVPPGQHVWRWRIPGERGCVSPLNISSAATGEIRRDRDSCIPAEVCRPNRATKLYAAIWAG